MATYIWSTLTDNQTIVFNSLVDVLHFDGTISGADLGFSSMETITFTVGDKSVTLDSGLDTWAQMTTTNMTFANGSRWIFGDNTTGIVNDNGPNTLTGSSGNDSLIGWGGNDLIDAGAGDDDILFATSTGAFGNDTIDGGPGTDLLLYSSNSPNRATVSLITHTAASSQGTATLISIETVRGTGANDTFIGGDPAHGVSSTGNRVTETFRGRGGHDSITGGSGTDVVGKARFFTGADYSEATSTQVVNANLFSGKAADGTGATDTLANIDMVFGGAGHDILTGGSLSRAQGGTFFEALRGNSGNDVLNGRNAGSDGADASGDRADYANNTAAQAIVVNLSDVEITVPVTVQAGQVNDGRGGTDTLIEIDQVYGGAGDDTFVGGARNDTFDGGRGNDTLDGGAGIDEARFQQSTARVIVNLSASAIVVSGTTVASNRANDGMGGTDTLISIESVRGSDFNDHFRGSDDVNVRQTFGGDAGSDFIDGGAGIDFASYSSTPLELGGINAFIQNGAGSVADRIGGTDTLVNIEGISGTSSGDTLTGGTGDQWFRGRGGNDTINGGAGTADWVTHSTDPSGVSVNLATGKAVDGWDGQSGILNLGGVDTLTGIENVEGSDYADVLVGNAGANVLEGRAGNDILSGGGGADTLDGGAGNDVLKGLAAVDVLTGGEGRDRFDFDAVADSGGTAPTRDEITDFSHAQGDKVDLATIDANDALAGDQAFVFIGTAAFSGSAAGELRFDTDNRVLFGSTDADADAEFSILMSDVNAMVVGDFIL